jgi:hypothetical protein
MVQHTNSQLSFSDFIQQYDRTHAANFANEAERQRTEMLRRYPFEKWETLALEEYTLGLPNSTDSYCNWLERKTPNLGSIRGGSSTKHMIYFGRGEGQWKWSKRMRYTDERAAWTSIRQGFHEMFSFAQVGRWSEIDDIQALAGGNMVRLKTLHLYFPTELMPIYSETHLRHYLALFGVDAHNVPPEKVVRLNRLLLERLRREPQLNDWSNCELMRLLYDWAHPRNNEQDDNDEVDLPMNYELYEQLAEALEHKGQVILYGPPGTGKSFHADAFAQWWLNQGVSDSPASTPSPAVRASQNVWWIVANPRQWSWDNLFTDGVIRYKYGRLGKNYPLVQVGDLVIGYLANPTKQIVALARIHRELSIDENGQRYIELEPVARVLNGLTNDELKADPLLKDSEPVRFNYQGTLFRLAHDEAEYLLSLLGERDDALGKLLQEGEAESANVQKTPSVSWVTFHPTYSYEDFIEGYRPDESASGEGLVLRRRDGIFKQICREAQLEPNRAFVLIIDEINRANLTKVFGELITLIEKDKRGKRVRLPLSGENFTVPLNVYIIGTMNTADRSIRLLDAAIRRRFAFIELLPDYSVLAGATVGSLDLGKFLQRINLRLIARQGREKQIGHALLMPNGEPARTVQQFARIVRQELLPLLQEYCYDDFRELSEYIGADLVDRESATFTAAVSSDEALLDALQRLVNG